MQKKFLMLIAIMVVCLAVFSSESNAANNYEKQGLSLPDGYPQDLVPLMDGYVIVAGALGNKGDQKEVWVKYMVDTDIDQAGAFYKEILSRGKLQYADKMGKDLYMMKGELEGKTVSVKVGTEIMYDNYQSSILVSIIGDIKTSAETGGGAAAVDLSKFNKKLTNMDKVPGDYPIDSVPLYGHEVKYGSKSEYKGNDIFMVQVFSKEDKDQVRAIYKEVLKNASKKEEGELNTGSYTLGGVVENHKVSLIIGDTKTAGDAYKSFYTIQVDVLK